MLCYNLGAGHVYGVLPGLVVVEEILQAEELSLQYGEVAPVDLSVLTGLGDVTPRELNKHLFSEPRKSLIDRKRQLPSPTSYLEKVYM